MYWEETKAPQANTIPDDVVDLAFDIRCRCLPVDNAYALRQALLSELSWLAQDELAGIHPIHGAESGNGWMRPENPRDLIYLSRRTKLMLRLPKERVADARALIGRTFEVDGHSMIVDKAVTRPLSAITTIFSRHVALECADNEEEFLREAVQQLRKIGIAPKKVLCGREARIATPDNELRVRSLMLADLTVEESIKLQLRGLGANRQLGCGLFVGYKSINAVGQKSE